MKSTIRFRKCFVSYMMEGKTLIGFVADARSYETERLGRGFHLHGTIDYDDAMQACI
jgi:hypothetical protein